MTKGLVRPQKFRRLVPSLAVLLGALFTAWPAFFNGFPLLYPDTIDYIEPGPSIARALFQDRFAGYYGIRSLIYSLGILPLHWTITAWPIVAMNCLLTAYLVWLVVRSLVPTRTVRTYLVLMLLLSLLTSMSWFASFVMPDILGPILYLSIYLLVFARDTLSRVERWSLYLISWWAVASHTTHLMIAVILCFLLASLALLGAKAHLAILAPKTARSHFNVALEFTIIIALAAGAQIGLNMYLTGVPSLNSNHPPFLTARFIEDGPGRAYLENHCKQLNWAVCVGVHNLSGTSSRFLWEPDGVMQNATAASQQQMLQQDMSLAIAIVRAYPFWQLRQSAGNFLLQLVVFGPNGLKTSIWVRDHINDALPNSQRHYLQSRQARDLLYLPVLRVTQYIAVGASLWCIAALLPWLRRQRPPRLLGLGFIVFSAVVVNALVTGPVSQVNSRFQSRVIWLVPLLAVLCFLEWRASIRQKNEISVAHFLAPHDEFLICEE